MHNLDNSNNTPAFAYTGAKPWHNLGRQVDGLMTVKEALEAGQADFNVQRQPLYIKVNNSGIDANGNFYNKTEFVEIDEAVANVRDDNNAVLGVVGPKYKIIQMGDALSIFDPIFGKGQAMIETVGMINHGKTGFLLARLPKPIEVIKNDIIHSYLLFSNSFDGSSNVQVMPTNVRVVCQNTLTMALKQKGAQGIIKIRHTKNANTRLDQAVEIMCESNRQLELQRQALVTMAKIKVDSLSLDKFLKSFTDGRKTPQSDTVKSKISEAFESSPGSDMAGYTGYGLFNAVTWVLDHELNGKADTDAWERSTFGSFAKKREKAADLILQMA